MTECCGYLGCTNVTVKPFPWSMCDECYNGADVIETLAARLYLADRRAGGGRDSWAMLADHRREPYRVMAFAARAYLRSGRL